MLLPFIMLIGTINVQQNAMVSIRTINIFGQRSAGSGVIIEKNKILTAAHVIDNVIFASATCNDEQVPVKPIAASPEHDLALIEFVDDCPVEPIEIAKTNAPSTADVYAVGCPAGLCFLVTKGIVSGYSTVGKTKRMWSDVKVWYGNSGGPIIDSDGKLIGIVCQMQSFSTVETENNVMDVNSQNYASIAPVSIIRLFLQEIENSSK